MRPKKVRLVLCRKAGYSPFYYDVIDLSKKLGKKKINKVDAAALPPLLQIIRSGNWVCLFQKRNWKNSILDDSQFAMNTQWN